ncbi:adenomatous polyposis coli protein-like [Porphyrio hochstetteri]
MVEQDDVEIVTTNIINPASFFDGNIGEPVSHDCLETIEATYSSCTDLKDVPIDGAEHWLTDGSSYMLNGKQHSRYAVTTSEKFSLQTDMTRRQLEYEARHIRAAMEEQLGTCQDMEKQAQVRVIKIQQIEKDILCVRQVLQAAEAEVEMLYSLLLMLGTHDKDGMSQTLLEMSSSQDSCIAMRQSGCLPLLIQLLYGYDKDSVLLGNSCGSRETRARASAALHNIIHSQPDDKRGRQEIHVLHLLEQIRAYCETCWKWQEAHEKGMDQDKNPMPAPIGHQICPAVCVLMKLSFDEEHRHVMNELGKTKCLQAIAELLQVDCEMYGLTNDHYIVTLRRYAGMALTNVTFGDVANKVTLCSMKDCMKALVAQLKSESEDLQQVLPFQIQYFLGLHICIILHPFNFIEFS